MDIERLSSPERLLWDYGIRRPEHIDLEAIANDHGAIVKYRPLGGCEARLVAVDNSAVISVNSNSTRGRQRFSLGHEIAHWICDRKSGLIRCAQEDVSPQNTLAKAVEAAANSYASQLILPSYLVAPWLQSKKLNLETAGKLGAVFTASLTAAALKLVKCAPTPAVLLCHSRNRLAWHQRSDGFPDLYFMSELSADTDAFRLVYGKTGGMGRAQKEPATRWASGKLAYTYEVMSQSIKLPDATVLTMLALVGK